MIDPTRWLRDYELKIGIDGQGLIVRPPFRVAFDCTKTTSSKSNKLRIRIWNLKEKNRESLVKGEKEKKHIQIELAAGYQAKTDLIFKGNVHKGKWTREGADLITELECLDGGTDMLYAFTSKAVTGKQDAIQAALGDMKNTGLGQITKQRQLTRPIIMVGNSHKIIDDMLDKDQELFIDNEQLFLLKSDEVREGYAPLVNAMTGLLNAPDLNDDEVTFTTMLNPAIQLGGKLKLESIQAKQFNGDYKATKIVYKGDSDGQEWTQTVTGKRL